MIQREEIKLTNNINDLLFKMSEGNPGALRVLMDILKMNELNGFFLILSLDDMNIRGTQIWVGYKNFCGEDIFKFIEAVTNRSLEMIDLINQEGLGGNHKHLAVQGEASFPGGRKFLS
jgi:hypothetical protein